METKTEKHWLNNGPLISVPHRDTIRLLEVYVKRSLSLNDGNLIEKKEERKEKWVTKKHRRHSSDPSLHLDDQTINEEIITVVEPPPPVQAETRPSDSEKPKKKSKKTKKPSFWKSLFGIFSRKSNEEKDEEQDAAPEMPETFEDDVSDSPITCLPTPITLQKKKSLRKRSIKRSFSKRHRPLSKSNKSGKDLNLADITGVEAVEPTYNYYEKVSEELEKIVHEVKVKEEVRPLSDEEVINRIFVLIKEESESIDDKLKDNSTLNNFFQGMSYTSFQRLADAYLVEEAAPTSKPPTVLPTAPELVKLAFTLDFTARMAGLSRQNLSHITCLGNRYLKDRFEYKQACTDHPWSDCED